MNKTPWVDRFEREILPEMVIILGSRIKGPANDESDIDVVIISDY
jgi:predicted nucleotidyltransferase